MSFPRYPNYKDTGLEWLGEVPAHWEVKRLGYYFNERREKVSDKDFEPLSVTKNGILPQLETAVKTDDGDNRKKVCAGDFVINSRSDRKGSSGLAKQDGSVSLINTVLAPYSEMNSYFAHHLFRSISFQEEYYRYGKGIVADLWSTNYSEMKNIVLALPPFPEQSAIAAFLDHETAKIDALIAEQQRLIELLKEKRQAVISHAVTKGLSHPSPCGRGAGGEGVPMKDSGIEWLGEVPAHWEIRKLTKCVKSIVDYRGKTPNKVDDGVFLLTARNIKDGTIDYDMSQEFVSHNEYDEIMRRGKTHIGDLVFTMEAPLGQVANIDRTDVAIAQRIIKLQGHDETLSNYFLKYWFMGTYSQSQLASLATGSTALGLKASKLGQIDVCLPPLTEQSSIITFLDNTTTKLDTLTAEAQRAIELLKERRAALISTAVTGKIDVRGLIQYARD